MARRSLVPLLATLLLGCADVGTGDDTNPFGDGTTGTGAGTAETPATSDTNTTGSDDASGGATTTSPTTDGPTTAEASSSGPPPGTDDATTAPGDTTNGGSGEGELGECIGLGVWESCAQYCEAVMEVCAESGCDGATLVYYDDVAACEEMQGSNGQATPCGEPFAMGGGVSFARCCCQ